MYKKAGITLVLVDFLVFINYFVILIMVLTGVYEYHPFGFAKGLFKFNSIVYPLLCLAVLILLKAFLNKKVNYNKRYMFKIPVYYLMLSFLLFNVFVIPVILNNYYNFNLFTPNDFCERAQAIFNTFSGRPLMATVWPWTREVSCSIFGDHFFVFLFALVPFCYFLRSPEYLLILQTLFLSAGVFPLFLIGRERLRNSWLALGVCVCYLLYPLTIGLPFCDFRLECFAVFFFLWAFYFLQKDKMKWCILSLVLAVLCKENLFVVSGFFGLYILLFKKGLKNRLSGVLVGIVSFFLLLLYLKVIQPFFVVGGTFQPAHNFSAISNFFTNVNLYMGRVFIKFKMDYLFNLFKVVVFLPFFSREVILLLPGILQNILSDLQSDNPLFVTINIWHSAMLLPFIFIGFICGIGNLFSLIRIEKRKWLLMPVLIFVFSFPAIYGLGEFHKRIFTPFRQQKLWKAEKPGVYETLLCIKNSLPKDKRTLVHLPLLHLFYDYEKVCLARNRFLTKDKDDLSVEYIIFSDRITYSQVSGVGDDRDLIKKIVPEDRFRGLLDIDGFVVLKRISEPFIISFTERDVLDNLQFMPNNSEDHYDFGKEGLGVGLEFDGGPQEDEYLQMKFRDINIGLRDFSWIGLEYEVEDKSVQTIELVFGIDRDNDGRVDLRIKGLYPRPASQEKSEYVVNLYGILGNDFKNKNRYTIRELEIYPHKIWGVDCRSTLREKVYRFKLYRLGFY